MRPPSRVSLSLFPAPLLLVLEGNPPHGDIGSVLREAFDEGEADLEADLHGTDGNHRPVDPPLP